MKNKQLIKKRLKRNQKSIKRIGIKFDIKINDRSTFKFWHADMNPKKKRKKRGRRRKKLVEA